jgi:hypothetical protein
MKEARLLNIVGTAASTRTVPHLGTHLPTVPHAGFVEAFQRTPLSEAVKDLARDWIRRAKQLVEPTLEDVQQAARAYFALKHLLADHQADAVMMQCLSGLAKPRLHVPPCMGFMRLRDEGIAAGCQADLDATLTLMPVQQLFGLPGFQQNAAMNTERNLYFGALSARTAPAPPACAAPAAPPEPFILRSHAEAGWGCVPQVLFSKGQQVTMALYQAQPKPQMLLYTGRVVDCRATAQ